MSSESGKPTDPFAVTVGDTGDAGGVHERGRRERDGEDEDDDFDLEDSLLRAVAAAPPIPVQSNRLAPGEIVGDNFRIESVLGAGAMGVVYEAFDLALDRRVALKLHARDGDDVRTSRMWREAKAMARLAHPHVIAVHEVGEYDGRVFIAMELVEGGTVRDWLEGESPRSHRSWQEVLRVFIQAAEGLAAAHAVELVHRDFKPDNILVGHDGRVRVADFGLARGAADEPDPALRMPIGLSHSPSVDDRLTQTGASVGTPAYMAPEQMSGLEVDHRCDQFSFCVALFEALYGLRPFDAPTLAALAEEIEAGRIRVPPSDRTAPSWLHAVVLRGLSPRPEDRFASMEQLLEALRADPSRRRRRIVLGATVVAALGLTAWVTRVASVAPTPCQDAGLEMGDLWNPDVASQIEQALRGTGSGLAEDAIRRVGPALDDYTSAWVTQRGDACRATRIAGVQSEAMLDRRMVCLDRRRQQVEAVVAVFSTPDVEVVKNAVQILGVLESLEACEDLEALQAQYPPPDDEATRRAVADVRADVATVNAATMAGRSHTMRAEAEAAVEQAIALEYPPLLAEAYFTRHVVKYWSNESEPSLADVVMAHRFAAEAGDARLAWRSCLSMARLVGRNSTGTDEALRWMETSEGWAQRIELSADDRMYSSRMRAEVYQQGDRVEEALEELERSLLHLEGGEQKAQDVAANHVGLAYLLRRLSRLEEARTHALEGIEQYELAYGPHHPDVARGLSILTHIETARGDAPAALVAIERSLEIRRKGIGEHSLSFASALRERADVFKTVGRIDEAIADYERALELQTEAEHREPGEEIMTINNLAIAVGEKGDEERALEYLGSAIDRAIEAFGAKTARVAELRLNYGSHLAQAKRYAESITQTEAALESLEVLLGPNSIQSAIARMNLALSFVALERYEEARVQVTRAEEVFAQLFPPTHFWLARIAGVEASVLGGEGKHAQALARRREALTLLEGSLGETNAEVVRMHHIYGVQLREAGDPRAAIESLAEAVEQGEAMGLSTEDLGRYHFELARALWSERARRDEARMHARTALERLDGVESELRAEIDAWLAAHR